MRMSGGSERLWLPYEVWGIARMMCVVPEAYRCYDVTLLFATAYPPQRVSSGSYTSRDTDKPRALRAY